MFPEFTRDEVFMIATERLWLRWPRAADAADLARISGDPRVAAKTATWPIGADVSYARERIARIRSDNANGTGFAFAITERSHWQKSIGLIGFKVLDGTQGAVAGGGYHLDPAHWGKGYATEAMAGLIANLRLLTRIARLSASVMPSNRASASVLLKNGFEPSGAGTMSTEFRGSFAVEHFARDLRLIGRPGIGLGRPMPRTGIPRSHADRCAS
jgi:RimJ/RimL family protein N-acetyltransferase